MSFVIPLITSFLVVLLRCRWKLNATRYEMISLTVSFRFIPFLLLRQSRPEVKRLGHSYNFMICVLILSFTLSFSLVPPLGLAVTFARLAITSHLNSAVITMRAYCTRNSAPLQLIIRIFATSVCPRIRCVCASDYFLCKCYICPWNMYTLSIHIYIHLRWLENKMRAGNHQ